ncbi:MAG: translocation/assembly module TamB domain-containing protein [Rhodobacteraceae bacterium]|nr:translocation/assembly module TamB domain-containing protein [Paracoccaceae bacterium]
MRRGLRIFLAAALLAPISGAAQDDDGPGYLTRLLQDNLSGAGREVRITGFEGALSSRAHLDTLTMADDTGVWLTIKDATLDWSRSALLSGAVEVTALSAAEIILDRLPSGGEEESALPTPEAQGFKLPELPVSISIGEISAESLRLGEPILGEAVEFKFSGAMSLADGEGEATLDVERAGDKTGVIAAEVAYANATDILKIDLELDEAADGIAARLLDLPGRPAVRLKASGDAPLSDFELSMSLATDGIDRVTGTIGTAVTRPSSDGLPRRLFRAALDGDIAPILPEDYRPFFGSSAQLNLSGAKLSDGRLRIDDLDVRTRTLRLTGRLRTGPDKLPEFIDLAGTIADPDGIPVVLPIPGPATRVDRASLSLRFDAARGDSWLGVARISNVTRTGLSIEQLTLDGAGRIGRFDTPDGGFADGISAAFDFAALGVELDDSAQSEALGRDLSGSAALEWQKGQPFRLTSLELSGAGITASAEASVTPVEDDLDVALRLDTSVEDAGRFSATTGRSLGGAVAAKISGSGRVLAGTFDLEAAATSQNLRVGQPEADRLLRGDAQLDLSLSRDAEGLHVNFFSFDGPAFRVRASGDLVSKGGGFAFGSQLTNIGDFVSGLSGPVGLAGTLDLDGNDMEVLVDGTGAGGVTTRVTGGVDLARRELDLQATASGPLALINRFIAPRSVDGLVRADLTVRGPIAISSISGRVTTTNARLVAPTLNVVLNEVDLRADLASGRAQVDATASVKEGGRVALSGPVELAPPFNADLEIRPRRFAVSDPELFDTRADGKVTVRGPLSGGARIEGRVDLSETEITIPSGGFGSFGDILEIEHVNQPTPVFETRQRAGAIRPADGKGGPGVVYPLDLIVRSPTQIFVRGRGLDAEMGGQIRLTGTSAEIIPIGQFELLRGRLDILGKRLALDEGLARLEGNFEPYIRFVARTQVEETRISIVIEGPASSPEILFLSEPELPQDEVLAKLLFGRDVQNLSPLQAARLASAVATLAGRGGSGAVGRLRETFGLDDLDITGSGEGTTEVSAGKYLTDNIYTEVTVGSDGSSEVDLNLDLSPTLTLKGSLDNTGGSSVGIFFERDY